MFNHTTLTTPFGQRFIIQTSEHGNHPIHCKPKVFTDSTYAKQFINKLSASPDFWRRLLYSLGTPTNKCFTHSKLIDELSKLLTQRKFHFIQVNTSNLSKHTNRNYTLKSPNGVRYIFEPASPLRMNNRENKKFYRIDTAITFLKEIANTKEQLHELSDALKLTQTLDGHLFAKVMTEHELITLLAEKLVQEEVTVIMRRPNLKVKVNTNNGATNSSSKHTVPLAPPTAINPNNSPSGPIEIQGGKLKNQVLQGYEKYKPMIVERELEVIVIQVEAHPKASDGIKMRAESSAVSARQKKITFEKMGYKAEPLILPYNITPKELQTIIEKLNNDPKISGIIVQMPVPDRLLIPVRKISAKKDLDALTENSPQSVPATSSGICRLAEPYLSPDSKIIVLGGKGFVGSGVVSILRKKGFSPQIIDLGDTTEALDSADVVISTVGIGGHVSASYLNHKPKKLLIDSGFTPTKNGPQGDFTQDALQLAKIVTPVPGGIGPTEMAVLAERVLIQDFGDDVPRWRYDGSNVVFDQK